MWTAPASAWRRSTAGRSLPAVNDGRAALGRAATISLAVNGQRYIGTGLHGDHIRIEVHGTPGQALAMFMDGPTVEVYGNAQDGVGNTMNSGQVIVHGGVGDVLGYGMRRGRIFVEGDADSRHP
jgi:glutamate synthase domain-containing protein 3